MNKDFFNLHLQLPEEELWWVLSTTAELPSEDIAFLINPRRLRGSDFLMRWSQGRWAEEVVIETLNNSKYFGAIPYGPSVVAPDDPYELESFFEKMDRIAEEGKRPDLLIFDKPVYQQIIGEITDRLGNIEKIAETPSNKIADIISKAKLAVEVENSLWVTEKMPGFGKEFSRYSRGKRKGSLKASGPVPTVIIKKEDIDGLNAWENKFGKLIYIVHVFYDRSYFIKFQDAINFLEKGDIVLETQKYTNPDGTASTPKEILKVPYILCKEFGPVSERNFEPKAFVDKNGKVMTYVTFVGGKIDVTDAVIEEWRSI